MEAGRSTKLCRLLPLPVIVMLLALALSRAATITVDLGDSTVDAADGRCSLREAITAANTDTASGDVSGECPAGAGEDTILFTGDVTLTEVDNQDLAGPSGLPLITTDMIVEGGGWAVQRERGAPGFRIWAVREADLTLHELTSRRGAAERGAGIYNDAGNVTLISSTISDNTGIGIYLSGFAGEEYYEEGARVTLVNGSVSGNTGDGIRTTVERYAPTVTLTHSELRDNGGHAVYARYGTPHQGAIVSLTETTVRGNFRGVSSRGFVGISGGEISDNGSGLGVGGGAQVRNATIVNNQSHGVSLVGSYLNGSFATITETTISANKGGIAVKPFSRLTLVSSTVSGNTEAGGIQVAPRGQAHITNSTISWNSTHGNGGGIYVEQNSVDGSNPVSTLKNVTLSGNAADGVGASIYAAEPIEVENTLLANGGADHCAPDSDGILHVVDLGHNLADDASCGSIPASLTGLDPLLADNGGPTQTHGLLYGSTAIDAAGECGLATDQRGVPRIGACDSGAVEVGPCLDEDGDGLSGSPGCAPQIDCDDSRPNVFPGAAESCDGLDNDCDGWVDNDGLGVDSDTDGVANACDNCTLAANPSQDDLDADRVGNVCDNCPLDPNPSQSDLDQDLEGDFCDLDDGTIYVTASAGDVVGWHEETGFDSWNVYRGDLSELQATGIYTQLPGALAARWCGLDRIFIQDPTSPGEGKVAFYLVTGLNRGAEGDPGQDSAGNPRPNHHPCPVAAASDAR